MTTRKKPRARSVRDVVREETRAAYREAILAAATKVFGRLGFHDAKMADIAGEAGVAAGTVYNYFASKEEIFASILEAGQARLHEAIAAVMAGEGAPMARVLKVLQTSYSFLQEGGPFFAVYLRQGGLAEWSRQRLRESDDQHFTRFVALLEELLGEAVEAGELRAEFAVDDLAAMLAGLSDAQVFAWVGRGCPPDLVARAAIVLDVFLHGAQRQ